MLPRPSFGCRVYARRPRLAAQLTLTARSWRIMANDGECLGIMSYISPCKCNASMTEWIAPVFSNRRTNLLSAMAPRASLLQAGKPGWCPRARGWVGATASTAWARLDAEYAGVFSPDHTHPQLTWPPAYVSIAGYTIRHGEPGANASASAASPATTSRFASTPWS